jgi:DNA-binding XRE family transcriptional regulator
MDWDKISAELLHFVHFEPNTGCWLWAGADNGQDYGKFRGEYAHRASYAMARGPIPQGMHLDHLCRVPCCVNPDHLEPVTNRVNAQRGRAGHHMKNGGAPRADAHRMAVMTTASVRALRRDCDAGMTQYEAARKYGISQPTVSQIVRGITWRNA